MKQLAYRLILILALMLSQTVVVMHDVNCLDGEHDQACEVFFAQDHSASNAATHEWVELMAQGGKPEGYYGKDSTALFSSYYLSRAPPRPDLYV